jgi:hypothetical protein
MLAYYLDKLDDRHKPLQLLYPLPSLEIRIAITNYSWTSRTFRSWPDHSGGWNHALVLVLKTMLHASFDWLMGSHKLQPCLDLTKVARWKSHFLTGISKRPICTIRWNGCRITQGTHLKRRVLCLESRCYNKSHSDPKLITSLRRMIESLSLFVSNPYLTFQTIACISINSNHKCTPWSASTIEPYRCVFVRAFLHPNWWPNSTHEMSMSI